MVAARSDRSRQIDAVKKAAGLKPAAESNAGAGDEGQKSAVTLTEPVAAERIVELRERVAVAEHAQAAVLPDQRRILIREIVDSEPAG